MDISQIQLHHFIKAYTVSGIYLPVSGAARCNKQPLLVVIRILRHLFNERRTGADQTHMAHQHVPELRQFIDARLADEFSDPGNAGVILDLEHRPAHFVVCHQVSFELLSIGNHGPEFIHRKQHLVLAHSVLPEEHLAFGILQLDQDGHKSEERQQDEKTKGGEKNINDPLHYQIGIHSFASFFGMQHVKFRQDGLVVFRQFLHAHFFSFLLKV
ncbi:hypothetical protein D3C75_287440 [compost metagenome]